MTVINRGKIKIPYPIGKSAIFKDLALTSSAVLVIAVAIFVSCVSDTQAQTNSVPLYDNLGDYHLEITTSDPMAQRYFDQGIRLYYGFNHAEAIRAFRAAQQIDPNCAMCWWGEALAWGPNINMPMDASVVPAALAASQQASSRKERASLREQALIDALAVRYKQDVLVDRAPLDQAYDDAMAIVVAQYPQDLDSAVLYGEALLDLRPWDYWTAQGNPQPGIEIALGELERVIAQDESHPGACHFYIHAVEAIYPEKAIPCAERLANLMPGAGHLVHMPGHIYIRIGRYLDAVKANEHAVHADESYIQDQRPEMGMYTAGYYPHNYDFMAFAAMMIGRSELAVGSARKVAANVPEALFGSPGMDFLQHWTERPLQMQVRFAQWQEILKAPEPPAQRLHSLGLWHYARGRALLGTGDIAGAEKELQQLRHIAANPSLTGLRMEFNASQDLLAIAERVLTGWLAATRYDYAEGIAALAEAVRKEDALFYGEPPEWSVPTRQDLGAVLLRAEQPNAAERAFREDLNRFPENGWSLYGLMQSLLAQDKDADAAQIRAKWQLVWATADVNLDSIF